MQIKIFYDIIYVENERIIFMKKFSIPGYFKYFNELKALIETYKDNPEYFYEDRCIDSSYDFPGGLIWNGGRTQWNFGYNPYDVDNIMQYYFNETDINLNHTCTNLLIDYGLAQDWLCNNFLHLYYREQDSVIVASKALFDHLTQTYPNMKLIYSTTVGIIDPIKVNEITAQDMIYVVNYKKNNNNEYLKKLSHPEQLEVICAEPCNFNCTERRKHYEAISEEQLWICHFDGSNFQCPYGSEQRTFSEIQKLPHAITNERVDELYDMGIQYFKISGRTINTYQWIETMVYYLVLPEYRDHVRQLVLNNMMN